MMKDNCPIIQKPFSNSASGVMHLLHKGSEREAPSVRLVELKKSIL